MDYSIKKAQEDIANLEIFKDIIENGDQLENDIYILESKKKEVNDIVKELQNKITLHDIV